MWEEEQLLWAEWRQKEVLEEGELVGEGDDDGEGLQEVPPDSPPSLPPPAGTTTNCRPGTA